MPTLAIILPELDGQQWLDSFAKEMPELQLISSPDDALFYDADYALTWQAAPGFFRRFRRLRAILSMWAGVDRLLVSGDIPDHLPIIRMVDPGLTTGMCEYIILHVLRYHRDQPQYEHAQSRSLWTKFRQVAAGNRHIGIMGAGVLGQEIAEKLLDLDFTLSLWSRSGRNIVAGAHNLSGPKALPEFLSALSILVCLLPLTPQTTDILDKDTFAMLPHGAYLINAGRGGLLVDADLLAALQTGQLAGATLDTFRTEPLPDTHPFWSQANLTITPHIAAATLPETAVPILVENIRSIESGIQPNHLVDRLLGY